VDTLISQGGCDSIATLILNVNPILTSTDSVTVCANSLPYIWNGNGYNAAGTYVDTLISQAGCDSIATLILNVNPVLTSTDSVTVCANSLPYIWNGNSYNAAGTYVDTLVSQTGCDSIATLVLNVNPVLTSTQTVSVCANALPYTWNGNSYNAAGTYADTLTSQTGCDSIATLVLNVNTVLTSTQTVSVCANALPYTWNGNSYNAAGTYADTLTSQTGCDSIATLVLNVNPILTSTQTATICTNALPYVWNGNSYNAAGTYVDTLTNQTGCDSIATLILNVNPVLTSTQTVTICANVLPYTWNGNSYNAAGTYVDTLTSQTGCDSIATLVLNVNPVLTSTQTVTVCANVLPYTWNGNSYNAAGTYVDTITSAAGCDSIATLVLNVNPTPTSTDSVTVCSSSLPYTWNGNSYNAAGNYSVTLQGQSGCDSIARLVLSVNTSPTLLVTNPATVCEPATVDLTEAGITAGSSPGLILTYWMDSACTIPLANPNVVGASGNYFIKGTATNGCSESRVVRVTVSILRAAPSIRYPTVFTTANTNLQLNARTFGSGTAYTWNPHVGLNNYGVRSPIFNYNNQVEYIISITAPGNGCPVVDTILVRLVDNSSIISSLHVPKAWSPNGDGHNDKLFPLTINVVELRYFRVFNRWGQLMFETNIIGQGWDGMYKGQPQVMDVYTWTVDAKGVDGKIYKLAGNSVLMR
jgi:gliding motility-associated-like protein